MGYHGDECDIMTVRVMGERMLGYRLSRSAVCLCKPVNNNTFFTSSVKHCLPPLGKPVSSLHGILFRAQDGILRTLHTICNGNQLYIRSAYFLQYPFYLPCSSPYLCRTQQRPLFGEHKIKAKLTILNSIL